MYIIHPAYLDIPLRIRLIAIYLLKSSLYAFRSDWFRCVLRRVDTDVEILHRKIILIVDNRKDKWKIRTSKLVCLITELYGQLSRFLVPVTHCSFPLPCHGVILSLRQVGQEMGQGPFSSYNSVENIIKLSICV